MTADRRAGTSGDRRGASSSNGPAARVVSVPWGRVQGWIERYQSRHPGTRLDISSTRATGHSTDGSRFSFEVPLGPLAEPSLQGLLAHLGRDWHIAVVLVRRGGFAVARLVGEEVLESKVGQRHVQGRSKAGGWSQQRFARRRDNQARAAFDAAAGYVQTLLVPAAASLDLLAVGGDKAAVDAVLAHPELAPLDAVPRHWLAGLADPRRSVLDGAVSSLRSVRVEIVDTASR